MDPDGTPVARGAGPPLPPPPSALLRNALRGLGGPPGRPPNANSATGDQGAGRQPQAGEGATRAQQDAPAAGQQSASTHHRHQAPGPTTDARSRTTAEHDRRAAAPERVLPGGPAIQPQQTLHQAGPAPTPQSAPAFGFEDFLRSLIPQQQQQQQQQQARRPRDARPQPQQRGPPRETLPPSMTNPAASAAPGAGRQHQQQQQLTQYYGSQPKPAASLRGPSQDPGQRQQQQQQQLTPNRHTQAQMPPQGQTQNVQHAATFSAPAGASQPTPQAQERHQQQASQPQQHQARLVPQSQILNARPQQTQQVTAPLQQQPPRQPPRALLVNRGQAFAGMPLGGALGAPPDSHSSRGPAAGPGGRERPGRPAAGPQARGSVPLMLQLQPSGGARAGAAAQTGARGSSRPPTDPVYCDWPEARKLMSVSEGVRIKGMRLSRMMDGVMTGHVPHLFRVHSTSGQAEWWPVDMTSGLCACPNNSDVCSHIFGVACLNPQYRIWLATVVKARELVHAAAKEGTSPDSVVGELARCVRTWTQRAAAGTTQATATATQGPHAPAGSGADGGGGYGDGADACQVCAQVAVALLLQGVVESLDVYGPGRRGGNRRRLWWQQAVQASGAPAPSQPLDSPPVSRDGILQELKAQLAKLVAAMEGDARKRTAVPGQVQTPAVQPSPATADSSSPPVPATAKTTEPSLPHPMTVLGLLLELERSTCAALHLDDLFQWGATHGAADTAADGGGGGGGGGLLALLADGGRELSELFERACELVLQLKTAAAPPATEPAAANTDTPGEEAPEAAPDAVAADAVTVSQLPGAEPDTPLQHSPGSPSGDLKAGPGQAGPEGTDGGTSPHAAGAGNTAALSSEVPAPVSGAAAGGSGGVSPLLQVQLAAFCRQALAATVGTAGSAADSGSAAVAAGCGDGAVKGPGAIGAHPDRDVFAHVERLACRQFGAERFTDLVSHGSVERLLAECSPDGSSGLAHDAGTVFAAVLLVGAEEGDGDGGRGDGDEFGDGRSSAPVPSGDSQPLALTGCGDDPGADTGNGVGSSLSLLELVSSLSSPPVVTRPGRVPAVALLSCMTEASGPATVCGEGTGPSGNAGMWGEVLAAWQEAAGAALGGPVVAVALPSLAGGRVLVDPSVTTRDFSEALSRLDGGAAVGALLGLTAAAGSVAALPLELLKALSSTAAETALVEPIPTATDQRAAQPEGSVHALPKGPNRHAATRLSSYILDVAASLPQPFIACRQLVRLLLPPRLQAALLDEARKHQPAALTEAQDGAPPGVAGSVMAHGSAAEAAVAAAEALPGSLCWRTLVALWQLGSALSGVPSMQRGRPDSGAGSGLCALVESALRHALAARAADMAEAAREGEDDGRSAAAAAASRDAAGGAISGDSPSSGKSGNEDDDDGGEDDIVFQVPRQRGPNGRGREAIAEVKAGGSGPAAERAKAAAGPVVAAAATAAAAAAAALTGPMKNRGAKPAVEPTGAVPLTGTAADPASSAAASAGGGAGEDLTRGWLRRALSELPAWRRKGRVSPEEARRVIESIRQQEFGVGVAAPPELAAVLATQARRLQRALTRLAADLYSSRVHLLLELLQNADDCSYPPELAAGGEEPCMALRVGPTGLVVATNERGFTEADVRALCDVGASSKAAAKQQQQQQQQHPAPREQPNEAEGLAGGQTGEKGIGFKSVFALSDTPAIFSNGFAFGFDAQDPTGLGYVLPQPLDPAVDPTTGKLPAFSSADAVTSTTCGEMQPAVAADLAPPPAPATATGWGTVIRLPAAPRLLSGQRAATGPPSVAGASAPSGAQPGSGADGSGPADRGPTWRRLAAGLVGQVRPGVMLFLRRVRRLEVQDELGGVWHTLTRRDKEGGAVVEVTWRVEPLTAPSDAAERGPTSRQQPAVRETVYTWVVGASTLAPPLVTRGSSGARPAATTVKVALPLPPRRVAAGSGVMEEKASTGPVAVGSEPASGPGPSDGGEDEGEVEGDDDGAADAGAGGGDGGGRGHGGGEDGGGGRSCQVYATLPLRPSGLPFDLQADWLVPSSREDITAGEAWNQMLRDQVPTAFVDAVRLAMRLYPHMRRGGWLAFVPTASGAAQLPQSLLLLAGPQGGPGGGCSGGAGGRDVGNGGGSGSAMVLPFLRPVVGAIAAALRATPCVLCHAAAGSSGEGELVRPSQAVLGASEVLRRLLPSQALAVATGLRYAITDGLVPRRPVAATGGPPSGAGHSPDAAQPRRATSTDPAAKADKEPSETGHAASGASDSEAPSPEEVAAVDSELLPPSGVVSALGMQVFQAQHGLAAVQALLLGDQQKPSGGSPQDVTRLVLARTEAAWGGPGRWRWQLLAAMEELLEEREVQLAHSAGARWPHHSRGTSAAFTQPAAGPGGSSSLAALISALRGLPLVPLVGGRVAPAGEALMPPGGGTALVSSGAAQATSGPSDSQSDALSPGPESPGSGVLGEGGFVYGFEGELPLVDLTGLEASLRRAPLLRDRALRCLSRLGLGAPLPPSDVISRHVLPALHGIRAAVQQQQQLRDAKEPSKPNEQQQATVIHDGTQVQAACPVQPNVLVGYAAYLLHHQHLAARDPRVAQQWADALLWVLVPPLPAVEQVEPSAAARTALAPGDGDGDGTAADGTVGVVAPDLRSLISSKEAEACRASPQQVLAAPSGWVAVPSSEGICIGLSFPGLLVPGGGLAARAASAATAFPAGSRSHATGGATVPAAAVALRALAKARADVPCALWSEAYLRFGGAAQWAHFCGPAVLGCGFSFARVVPSMTLPGLPRPAEGTEVALSASDRPADGASSETGTSEPWVSEDLEALLDSLGVSRAGAGADKGCAAVSEQNVAGQQPGGSNGVVLPVLCAVAHVLDMLWSAEYERRAWLPATEASGLVQASGDRSRDRPTSGSIGPGTRRPSAFLRQLRERPWLPDTWGGCASPASGVLLHPSSRSLRSLLGPNARYAGADLTDPRFTAALGLPTGPSLHCVLAQLRQWQRLAATAAGRGPESGVALGADVEGAADVAGVEGTAAQIPWGQVAGGPVGDAATRPSPPPQPTSVNLASCYGYLARLMKEEEEATVVNEDMASAGQAVPATAGVGATDGAGECAASSIKAAVQAAFAEAPLIAVPYGPGGSRPAVAGSSGFSHGTHCSGQLAEVLQWLPARRLIWSWGPLAGAAEVLEASARGSGPTMAALGQAVALMPPRLEDSYPASLEPFFASAVVGVPRHLSSQHLLQACRRAAAAAAPGPATISLGSSNAGDGDGAVSAAGAVAAPAAAAAALVCVGWLGWVLMAAMRRDSRSQSWGQGSTKSSGQELRHDNGKQGPAEAGELVKEDEAEVLRALRQEALLPTVDGRWVRAPAANTAPRTGGSHRSGRMALVLDCLIQTASPSEGPEAVASMPGAGVSADGAAAAASGAAARISVAGCRRPAIWRPRDTAAALPALLNAAAAAGQQLDVIGPPMYPSAGAAMPSTSALQPESNPAAEPGDGETARTDGAPSNAEAPHLLADLPIVSGSSAAGLAYLLREKLGLPTLGSLVDVDVSIGAGSLAAVAPAGAVIDDLPEAALAVAATATTAGATGEGGAVAGMTGLEAGPAEAARRVLERLNDLAPYLQRWAAGRGIGARVGATREPQEQEQDGAGDGVKDESSVAEGSGGGGNWAELAERLRVVSVQGSLSVVHSLAAADLRSEPRAVPALLTLSPPPPPPRHAELPSPAPQHLSTTPGEGPPPSVSLASPVLYVSCAQRDTTTTTPSIPPGVDGGSGHASLAAGATDDLHAPSVSAGGVLPAGGWQAVFSEVSRLLFDGQADPDCCRFLLLLHTLMEAGQTGPALEATVAALYGRLPPLPPPVPAGVAAIAAGADVTPLRFARVWEARALSRALADAGEEGALTPTAGGGAGRDGGRAETAIVADGYGEGANDSDSDGQARSDAEQDGDDPDGMRGQGGSQRANGSKLPQDGAGGQQGGKATTRGSDHNRPTIDGTNGTPGVGNDEGEGDEEEADGRRGQGSSSHPPGPRAGDLDADPEGDPQERGNRRRQQRDGDAEEQAQGAWDQDAGQGPVEGDHQHHGYDRSDRGGLGGLAQASRGAWAAPPSAAFQQDTLDIGQDMHKSLLRGVTPIQLPVAPDDGPRAAREAVGRWGEQYVAEYLRVHAEPGELVEWVNANDEQCMPYDLVVRHQDTGEIVAYVEVKATSSWDKTYFEVSHREWLFAQQEGSRYHIYRLFGAGDVSKEQRQGELPRVVRIINPYLQWRSQRVGICLVL